jgi:sugar phosphate isomerase/epimerase
MLGDLYLCASMIEQASFEERVAAASGAGYAGIGLRPTHYKKARAAGLSDADMRARLEDSGVELLEIGFVADWWETGEKADRSTAYEQGLFRLADTLGGRHVVLISGPTSYPVPDLAERFARVCDRAAPHGLKVAVEPLPWTGMHDLAITGEIVGLADRPNGGVVLDAWHYHRGGSTADMLRALGPERVITLQLSDGWYEPVGTDLEDTFHRRALAGQGEFGIAGFLALVESLGIDCPLGVEVLRDELRALPAAESARLGLTATREVLAEARARGRLPHRPAAADKP